MKGMYNMDTNIDKVLDNIRNEENIYTTGKVIKVNEYNIEVSGLTDVSFYEEVDINGKASGYVFAIYPNRVIVSLTQIHEKVVVGDLVYALNHEYKCLFSLDSVGKVVDIFGNDLIAGKKFSNLIELPIDGVDVPLMDRSSVNRGLLTGIAGIDLIYPIGRGQRQLIIGDKKTGKTQICLDAIVNQKNQNVVCIYVAIGKTKKEVKELYYDLNKNGAATYTVIMASFNDELPTKSYLTPYVALTVAQELMLQKFDVLVIIDDLKKHADIYRQISLTSDKVPGRDAYPSDIFYTHARMLEKGCQHKDGGSVTILPIVETKGSDITDYISTNIISITDGQIVLSKKNFDKGEKPAIDYGLSVSRLGGAVQKKDMSKLGTKIRRELLTYLDVRDIYELSDPSELSDNIKEKITYGNMIIDGLKQYKFAPRSEDEMKKIFSFMNKE